MGTKRGLVFLVFLGFFILYLDIPAVMEGFWSGCPVGQSDLVRPVNEHEPSQYDRFGKELLAVLSEVIDNQQALDEVCRLTRLQEEVYQVAGSERTLLVLYLSDDFDNRSMIWLVDVRGLKDDKAMKVRAREAASVLLRELREVRLREGPLLFVFPKKRRL